MPGMLFWSETTAELLHIGDVFIERRDETLVESEPASHHHDALSHADRLQQP